MTNAELNFKGAKPCLEKFTFLPSDWRLEGTSGSHFNELRGVDQPGGEYSHNEKEREERSLSDWFQGLGIVPQVAPAQADQQAAKRGQNQRWQGQGGGQGSPQESDSPGQEVQHACRDQAVQSAEGGGENNQDDNSNQNLGGVSRFSGIDSLVATRLSPRCTRLALGLSGISSARASF